jgi:hypothetical protein
MLWYINIGTRTVLLGDSGKIIEKRWRTFSPPPLPLLLAEWWLWQYQPFDLLL